jgi:FkbM family methyltransferase
VEREIVNKAVRYLVDQTRRRFRGYVLRDKMQLVAAKWFRDRGDDTLRFQYPLNRESVVFDCGGYEGDWAQEIHDRFGCHVHVFEPVPQFAVGIQQRFSNVPEVRIHSFGLQGKDESVPLHLSANASSAFGSGESAIVVQMRDVAKVFAELGVARVTLMKINIEGGEYDLLDRLIDARFVDLVEHIQVQFHNFVPDAGERRDSIRSRLQDTHCLQWDYPFIWESWSRKS